MLEAPIHVPARVQKGRRKEDTIKIDITVWGICRYGGGSDSHSFKIGPSSYPMSGSEEKRKRLKGT